jgi:hypothetical protein
MKKPFAIERTSLRAVARHSPARRELTRPTRRHCPRNLRSKPKLGFLDVQGDLSAEVSQRGELFFVAQFFQENQFQLAAVKIALKIEQVRFDTHLLV